MLAVGTRVKLRIKRECRYRHAAEADGQVGTVIAIVTEDVLVLTAPADSRVLLTLDSFDGHLYSVELDKTEGLAIELCAASELSPTLIQCMSHVVSADPARSKPEAASNPLRALARTASIEE